MIKDADPVYPAYLHVCRRVLLQLLACLCVGVLLSGCSIRLAPDYDAELVNGLANADQQTLVLFAKVDTGSTKADFPRFADEYAQDIASFEALQQRAAARPFPPLTARITKLKFLSGVCDPAGNPKSCLDASQHALDEIVDTLRTMRDTHSSAGLPPLVVRSFKDRLNTNMHTLLTIESALRR